MRPTPAAAAALALGLGLAALAALPASPASAEGGKAPRFRLTAKAARDRVRLGEKIRIELALQSAAAKAVATGKIEIGSPKGVVLYVGSAGQRFQVSRLFGKYEGNQFKEAALPLEELKPGKTLEGAVEIPAVRTGRLELTPVFLGVDRAACPDPLEAKPVVVTVDPGPAGETRIGARIRTSRGAITVELLPDRAYNTVTNFATLAGNGFYNGRVFHRIVKDFMVQGGCPNGNGTGGPGYYVPSEFNDLRHEKGVISMARETHPNTAGSQFFIVHGTSTGLDGRYTGFGRVVEGLDVVDAMAALPVRKNAAGELSDPVEKPVIEGVDVVLLK